MKKLLKKLAILLCLSALSAGVFFALGFGVTLPKGVIINGEEVGGLSYADAAKKVREKTEKYLKEKELKISGGGREYVFRYPEIYYKDDLSKLLRTAKKGQSYTAKTEYYLCGLNEIAAGISLNERVLVEEPSATFKKSGEPFIYSNGHDGKEVDASKLKADIINSLSKNFQPVTISFIPVCRKTTIEEVKRNTSKLGSFTTYFDGGNINRSSNIRLAAALINGKILKGGESFSFNAAVGARIPSRGFLTAKIIENGEYTEGVGGGVCQVSTTLYNAAILSGMEIEEYHPHSLSVGYVSPSRDAMVSGEACDLKFSNPSKTPVYIRAEAGEGFVTFTLYGLNGGATYSLESVILERIPPEEENCEDIAQAREGKEGIKSECYLVENRGGFIKRKKLRTDFYKSVKRVIYAPLTTQNIEN